ncbi:hypothetical protein HDU83_002341 [Entophlyctis luteolus]|nr:hypothetical protein HDU83_002341 [Entophlyctis luteolus]KAJ3388619.1 hypothetical protein HDU84_009625 [Entophlyctis sp. JEL0112]
MVANGHFRRETSAKDVAILTASMDGIASRPVGAIWRYRVGRKKLMSGRSLMPVSQTPSTAEIAALKRFRASFSPASIPTTHIDATYSRASGPGGQNVNKVNSKAELRFAVANASEWIHPAVVDTFVAQNHTRINRKGEFVIASDRFRTQAMNYTDALERICEAVKTAVDAVIPAEIDETKVERVKELKTRDNEHRLAQKQKNAKRKEGRRLGRGDAD